jgi:menaquinone-dependent protoporphyrinogen IX oxidase
MNKKVLVACASKYGATKEIAEKIGQMLDWLRNTVANVQTDSTRFYIKCDFSLGGK